MKCAQKIAASTPNPTRRAAWSLIWDISVTVVTGLISTCLRLTLQYPLLAFSGHQGQRESSARSKLGNGHPFTGTDHRLGAYMRLVTWQFNSALILRPFSEGPNSTCGVH